ncbi:uncharacterized protein LOC112177453 [Rosa chinensis]|uniref:uncharacterized protein LOC112177453 n=1 Tax=Rosa chinensis TaxID=74649 RepID=UPI000D08D62B|nr:uncharacterized protein LOC112177453 [Rosa chinensis]
MAEKNQQLLASANGYSRKDEESATLKSEDELKSQKRIKLAMLGAINVRSLNSVLATPSFDTTQIKVKNTNWGPHKFDASIATFMDQGVAVEQVSIPKSKAGMHSTKKIDVTVSLNSNGLSSSNLGSDLNGGILTLGSQAKLTGKVELMFIMKKKKSANMDCTIAFNLSSKAVQTLQCK